MSKLNKKLFRDLLHLRSQIVAVAAVLACGIATFVTMQCTYRSLLLSRAYYYSHYRFADIFVSLKRAPLKVAAEIARLPGVTAVEARVVMEVTLDVTGLDEPATARLVSIPSQSPPVLNTLHIRSGQYITSDANNEVIASEAFATANNLKPGDEFSAILNGRWQRLHITGIALSPEYVYEVRGAGTIFPDNRRFGVLWMSRERLAAVFDIEEACNDIVLSIDAAANEAEVISGVDRLLVPYGGQGAYGRSDQISNRFLSAEITQNRSQGLVIPVIFLAVAVFLFHIVLSRLAGTQRDQIAVLKAFGYSNSAIGFHYLQFALIAAVLGWLLGALGGLWFGYKLTEIYTDFYRFPMLNYAAGRDILIISLLISCSAAAAGALSPVIKAVTLPPAEAMRPELPARFRPLIIERLGFHNFFSSTARMVIRNLERNPLKALFSVLGISLAVAILVVGRYPYDAIDLLIELQFRQSLREDVGVTFNNPRSNQVLYELARLPGVMRIEPFRVVPARLRARQRSRRVALQGVEVNGELHRLVGADMKTVTLPPKGLVLTAKLAELLAVKPGEMVTVELLEGNRAIRRVPVVATVDELIGTSAYINIDALNRLMRESRTISGAHLTINEQAAAQLYARLKILPAVSGVNIRAVALQSFQATMAKSMLISTIVIIIFASIIAFGVIFNSARIALSERGRELASLRVLGFTRAEIAFVLLGEQALLTLFAVPIGYLLGYAGCLLISHIANTELFRMPVIVTQFSYAYAFIVTTIAALISALFIYRRIAQLDLIEVLKTRE